MSDLPTFGIGFEHDSVETLLDHVLTRTDIRIIEATAQHSQRTGKAPTASDILKELEKANSLKKTQLYDRLNRLTRLGFISVRVLPRPRKYVTNRNTIAEGVERWIEEKIASIANISSELESFSKLIKQTKTETIVYAITSKLSLDITSNAG